MAIKTSNYIAMFAWKVGRFDHTLPFCVILCSADDNVRDNAELFLPLLLEDQRQPSCLVLQYCPPLALVNSCSVPRVVRLLQSSFWRHGVFSSQGYDMFVTLCFQSSYKVGWCSLRNYIIRRIGKPIGFLPYWSWLPPLCPAFFTRLSIQQLNH